MFYNKTSVFTSPIFRDPKTTVHFCKNLVFIISSDGKCRKRRVNFHELVGLWPRFLSRNNQSIYKLITKTLLPLLQSKLSQIKVILVLFATFNYWTLSITWSFDMLVILFKNWRPETFLWDVCVIDKKVQVTIFLILLK